MGMSSWDISGKTIVITGANTGIGEAAAEQLARRGANVVIASRSAERGSAAVRRIAEKTGREVGLIELDLASFSSIRRAASELLERCPAIHVLVNNAGLLVGDRRTTADGFELTLGVNHIGHFLLTELLLDRLVAARPSRIVNVSSAAHRWAYRGLDWDDLMSSHGYAGLEVYAKSKLANIYFTRELARRLAQSGVTAYAVHPGVVATRFARDGDARGIIGAFYAISAPLLLSPARGARTIVYCASEPGIESESGGYFVRCRRKKPLAVALRDDDAARLWVESERWARDGHP
jgi:NAD(P)-dependent dehydrogenase (short-subunit alcohol dehydrogenase family)